MTFVFLDKGVYYDGKVSLHKSHEEAGGRKWFIINKGKSPIARAQHA